MTAPVRKGQRVGYVRVSTFDQNPARQLEGMTLDKTFTDHASGRDANRPALRELLAYVREGDLVVVHAIDRLARNLDDLRRLVNDLVARGVAVSFVTERLTFAQGSSPMETMLLSVMGALAEFERSLIAERQREGVALAKRAGKYKGRKRLLSPERVQALRERLDRNEVSKAALAKEMGIGRRTLYRYLEEATGAAPPA